MHADLEMRCKDLAKLLRGFRAKLKQVQRQNSNMAKMILESAVLGVERNFGVLSETSQHDEASMGRSFDLLLTVFAALLAMDLIDRISDGALLAGDTDNAEQYVLMKWVRDGLYKHFVDEPGAWFAFNIAWLIVSVGLFKLVLGYMIYRGSGQTSTTYQINQKLNIEALESLLATKKVESRTSTFTGQTKITKVQKLVSLDLL